MFISHEPHLQATNLIYSQVLQNQKPLTHKAQVSHKNKPHTEKTHTFTSLTNPTRLQATNRTHKS